MSPATQLVGSLSDKFDFSAFGAGHPEDSINWVTSIPKPDMDGRAVAIWRQDLFSDNTRQAVQGQEQLIQNGSNH